MWCSCRTFCCTKFCKFIFFLFGSCTPQPPLKIIRSQSAPNVFHSHRTQFPHVQFLIWLVHFRWFCCCYWLHADFCACKPFVSVVCDRLMWYESNFSHAWNPTSPIAPYLLFINLIYSFIHFSIQSFTESQIVDNASSQSSTQEPPTSQQRQYNYADNNTDDLTWELVEFEII